jgi:hypothetical protein
LESLFGERIADLVDSIGAAEGILVVYLMSEFLTNGGHHGHALFANLRPDTVAGQHCNVKFHLVIFFYLLIILDIPEPIGLTGLGVELHHLGAMAGINLTGIA